MFGTSTLSTFKMGQMVGKAAFEAFVMFWPIWIILLLLLIGKILLEVVLPLKIKQWKFKKGLNWRSGQDQLQWLRGMHPSKFEEYITDLFIVLGYKAQKIGGSHDGGLDVEIEKDGKKSYIQCKKFIVSKVSVSAVRDFYGALANKIVDGKGYFITTNTFTLEAEKFAEDKPIELIDGFKLLKYIELAEKQKSLKGVESTENKKCPKCGGELIKKSGKFGPFYGCENYPKCSHTENIKNK